MPCFPATRVAGLQLAAGYANRFAPQAFLDGGFVAYSRSEWRALGIRTGRDTEQNQLIFEHPAAQVSKSTRVRTR